MVERLLNDYLIVFLNHVLYFFVKHLLNLWNTDDKSPKIFFNNNEPVCIEIRKKESRNGEVSRMAMHEVLKRYQNEELYLVEDNIPCFICRCYGLGQTIKSK